VRVVTIEGELVVRLAWDGRQVLRTSIRSSRPIIARRILSHRTAAEAVALVPALFSVCAGAQGVAAASAVDAALGREPSAASVAAREATAAIEAVQEHFSRLLLDWPDVLRRPKPTAIVARARRAIAPILARALAGASDSAAMRALAADLEAIAQEHLYGMPAEAWLSLSAPGALERWLATCDTLPATMLATLFEETPALAASDVALLPAATVQSFAATIVPALVRDADFAAAPLWHDAPAETGALSRQRTHPLIAALVARDGHAASTRLTARLVDLASILVRLRRGDAAALALSVAVGEGEGFATVETARGMLAHRVRIDDGLVSQWDIVAPTEWNFHPRGAAARGLATLSGRNRAEIARHARIAVTALDPCVGCRVEVDDA
jgi:Ni,Fe-hydrogenase I large subunit